MDIKIFIAAHKPYRMPEDEMYVPVQAGSAGKESIGYDRDDTGDNISPRNPNYCELTVLYWAWKNTSSDYAGLVHYRRNFASRRHTGDKFGRIITKAELEPLLAENDILLPVPRDYIIDTNWGQYVHAHHEEDLTAAREILTERCPEYVGTFDSYMKRTKGHRFNMFIMSRDKFDSYCEWLFDILFELEKRLDISGYSAYDARVFGFVAERLLDIWIEANGYAYREIPYVFLEQQNWLKKGWAFVKRRFS